MTLEDLSETQKSVLRELLRAYPLSAQIARYGAAPRLSAARALCRKGLACPAYSTGHYILEKEALELAEASRSEYRARKLACPAQN